jgi:hypothetical protein
MKHLLVVALLLQWVACGGEDEEVIVPEPTLSSIQENVFKPGCSQSSCHGAREEGGLSLVSGNSFAELVNVPAEDDEADNAGKLRVVPGDPDASFLIQKLEGPEAGEGDQMPDSGDPLPQEVIDVIRQWIEDGALDN